MAADSAEDTRMIKTSPCLQFNEIHKKEVACAKASEGELTLKEKERKVRMLLFYPLKD